MATYFYMRISTKETNDKQSFTRQNKALEKELRAIKERELKAINEKNTQYAVKRTETALESSKGFEPSQTITKTEKTAENSSQIAEDSKATQTLTNSNPRRLR